VVIAKQDAFEAGKQQANGEVKEKKQSKKGEARGEMMTAKKAARQFRRVATEGVSANLNIHFLLWFLHQSRLFHCGVVVQRPEPALIFPGRVKHHCIVSCLFGHESIFFSAKQDPHPNRLELIFSVISYARQLVVLFCLGNQTNTCFSVCFWICWFFVFCLFCF
jgi:hypothetical protein